MNVRDIIANRIIEKLEKGVIPWRRPWNSHPPLSWATGKPYRGINALLLEPGEEYITFKEAARQGGTVKAGTSELVVFWNITERTVEVERDGKKTKKKEGTPFLRYYRVFPVSTVQGIKRRIDPGNGWEPQAQAESVWDNYPEPRPTLKRRGRACYRPTTDEITMPAAERFTSRDEYYSTLFHELIHSTLHETRLNREHGEHFGDDKYGKEELVAEMGAAFLCQHTGTQNEKSIENNAAYIGEWIEAIRGDSNMVVGAASQAGKATDWIMGTGAREQGEAA